MNEPGGLVILSQRSPQNYLLINRLAADFPLAAVVFETDRAGIRRGMLKHRLRRLGWGQVAGQLLYLLWERRPWRHSAKYDALLAEHDLTPPDDRWPVNEVPRINDPAVAALLERLRPPLVVVAGTGIIRREVLALAPLFLNIHCGLTPRYRGVYGAWWAVWEGRPEDAGVTIHAIDPGVDTGDIARQGRIEVEPDDEAGSLVIKQYRLGAELMVEAVAAARAGELQLRPAEGESRQWYHPTLWDEGRFRRHRKQLRR